MTPKERFLGAIKGEKIDRPPLWMMRQAGRYMPSYMKTREGNSFLDLCHKPELASKVTVAAIEELGFDAAIIFCDILIPAASMGMNLEFDEKGPKFTPYLKDVSEIRNLTDFDAVKSCGFLSDAIKLTTKALGEDFPVLGFCGAPFTLAAYMMGDLKQKYRLKQSIEWILKYPKDYELLIDKITSNLKSYLKLQADAGVCGLQIFDTWGGYLSPDLYRRFLLPRMAELVDYVKSELKLPVMLYTQNLSTVMDQYIELDPDVVSVDWKLDILEVRKLVPDHIALQGNLQPEIIAFDPDYAIRSFKRWAKELPTKYIMNLGHGILPFTPQENVERIVRALK